MRKSGPSECRRGRKMRTDANHPAVGLVHRLDRGAQYDAALSRGKRLEEAGIVPSTGRVGSAPDNATSGSLVVASLKSGLLR